MLTFLWRRALRKRGRFSLTVFGVGLAILLFTILNTLVNGISESFASFVANTRADIIATPLTTFEVASGSFMPITLREEIEATPGVEKVETGLAVMNLLSFKKKQANVLVGGYQPFGLSEPHPIIKGRTTTKKESKEVVVDESLLFYTPGLELGDTVNIFGQNFQVTGVTQGHRLYTLPVVYVPLNSLQAAIGAQGLGSYFMVKTTPGENTKIITKIQKNLGDKMRVVSKKRKISEYKKTMSFSYTILYAIQTMVFLIGMLIIAVVIFISVVEQTQEFGILKSMGATTRYLSKIVLLDSVFIGALGFVIGIFGSGLFILIYPRLMPVEIRLTLPILIFSFGLSLIMGATASFWGIRRATRVDPMQAIEAL